MDNIKKAFFAEHGSEILSGAESNSTTGPFCALVVLNAAVIDSMTSDITGAADIEDTITLPAGVVLYGRITAVTLTSGVVQLINHPYA